MNTHLSSRFQCLVRFLAAPVMALALFGGAGIAAAQTIQPIMATTASPVCVTITHRLYIGSRDYSTAGEVTALQNFLAAQGYFHVASTGYFGSITYNAVAQFQASQGVSAIGLVGPLTRAAIARVGCVIPPVLSPVTIYRVTPTSGPIGTTVSITGFGFTSDNTIHFGNGAIVHVPISSSIAIACTTDPACHGGINQTLVFTVPGALNPLCYYSGCMSPSWQTTPGAYNVSVENTNGTSNAQTFTVTSGSVSTNLYINSISPVTGAIGTVVTLYGTGFNTNDYVMIAGGALKASTVSADGTQLTFTVPSGIGPYCAPGMMCAMYLRLITPALYQVSVMDSANGMISNSVSFTVTSSSSNQAPSISGIDTPSTLTIGVPGTWTVHASVPSSSTTNLRYSVIWGDEQQVSASGMSSIMMPAPSNIQTSATFTHIYHISGTYTPVFTVMNDAGQSAQVSSTILVTPIY